MFLAPMTFSSYAISWLLLFQNPAGSASAPPTVDPIPAATPVAPTPVVSTPVASTPVSPVLNDNYALGPGDQILIRAIDVEEIDNKPVLIDRRGNIDLPVVGKLQAAGLTPDQLEAALAQRLTRVLVHPDVSVSVVELRSQPVSILGSVGAPGVHQLQGDKTLFEVLSLAGGLRTDAGYTVIITRQIEWGPIPLADATFDSTGKFSVASVNVKSIMAGTNPSENIHIKPNDVITVPRGEIIYVIGAVRKPGGFMLNDHRSLSALQILSLAEGLDRLAAGQKARIMRAVPGSDDRAEIHLDLKNILAGKIPDVPLKADDILFVPVSAAKTAEYRTIDVLVGASTALIYRVP
jgi:polysaccharide export outer membrane protein